MQLILNLQGDVWLYLKQPFNLRKSTLSPTPTSSVTWNNLAFLVRTTKLEDSITWGHGVSSQLPSINQVLSQISPFSISPFAMPLTIPKLALKSQKLQSVSSHESRNGPQTTAREIPRGTARSTDFRPTPEHPELCKAHFATWSPCVANMPAEGPYVGHVWESTYQKGIGVFCSV